MKKEGGSGHPGIIVELCNEQVEIRFTERHMIDLQEMIKANGDNPGIFKHIFCHKLRRSSKYGGSIRPTINGFIHQNSTIVLRVAKKVLLDPVIKSRYQTT
jgi:hypothetical protein